MTVSAPPVWRAVEHTMGLPVSIAMRGRHAGSPEGLAAWAHTMDVLREADRVFSTYREDSWVSRLDRGEISLAECPPAVGEVLALGEAARRESHGAFDVRRPDATGRPRLDPSGVVKGWAVQRAADVALTGLADTDWCLGAGGDLVCHVAGPESPAWQIGIEDPHDPSRLLARVPVRDGAVASSGTAHRGAHLVDARTGRAPQGVAGVTVIAADLTTADVDATAAYALGPGALDWLRTRPARSGLVVWADGSTDTFAT